MPPKLFVFNPSDQVPAKRAERVWSECHAAYMALEGALRERGLLGSCDAALFASWRDLFKTIVAIKGYWENRAQRLERTLRNALASDGLTDEQRREILTVTYGRAAACRRDRSTISDAERALIDDYRAMDPETRRLIRGLFQIAASRCAPTPRTAEGESELALSQLATGSPAK